MNVRWTVSHTGNDNEYWAKFYNFPFISLPSLSFSLSLPVELFFFPSELCISISLNLSSLSWPQQFNVEHKHTKELNDAMICGTVVVIQRKDAALE